jgi:hypothetical protein
MLVLNRMSKRLKSVTKKLFGGKSSSRALSTDTLFQGRSTASRRRAEMMRHIDPSLVGSSTRSQRDEVTFSFSYHFSNIKLLTSLHLIFSGGGQLATGGGRGGAGATGGGGAARGGGGALRRGGQALRG